MDQNFGQLLGKFSPNGSVERGSLNDLRTSTNNGKKLFQFWICSLKHAFIDKAKVIAVSDNEMIQYRNIQGLSGFLEFRSNLMVGLTGF